MDVWSRLSGKMYGCMLLRGSFFYWRNLACLANKLEGKVAF
ncbi:hypothetical protein QY97_02319 [Bacillus thermotolerans]|uniref:Uncharacterized protein n=1 Tax=Bacillus thermotolerans TaxID=1221996 RepID=A0A0F5HX98_BACTR|nr:hypothetical protein QY96_03614 [Bacillus thermotolerans]KKB37926.1 hypothetical protein QY95_02703 [Bacillus thermotolerans]KKB38410.1 hypothetical protein QY97_02319 [Bacillus thermotolerans]